MKKVLFFTLLVFLLGSIFLISACEVEIIEPDPDPEDPEAEYSLGWFGEDNVSEVPTTTNFGFGSGNLPASVDLTDKFPPIGDQGKYGTCVAWAVGYNIKTALHGMSKGLSSSQLASSANQFSPKDLFTAIPDNEKGPDCNGTNFSNALNVLQNRGVATMQTVPYSSLGDCAQSGGQSGWEQEAAQNRIKYWRKVDPGITSIKQNLANNIPIIFGAKLGDNFMTWNSDQVLSSHTSFNNVGQHAYHAMVISGYDDNKGPNGAFKVINSWGDFWGSQGYIWVDYNFFIEEFCTSYNGEKPLFLAADEEGNINPPDDPDPMVSGVDLAPWVFFDESTYFTSGFYTEREINFNLYNIGNETASPSADWSIYYIYFNAYDANDYGVLFYDFFNTSVAPGTFECPTNYNCIFNYSIAPGNDFASTVWGWSDVTRTYYMPEITGSYYLVLIADADDRFAEEDEQNNLFYTTIAPKYFEGGYSLSPPTGEETAQPHSGFEFNNTLPPTPATLHSNRFNTIVSQDFPNAYTPEEILDFIKRKKESGELDRKVEEAIQRGGSY